MALVTVDCFGWQSRASEYLDGTLQGTEKKVADDHLDNCPACREHHKHYRLILESISGQPRMGIPESMRIDPYSGTLKLAEPHKQAAESRWSRTPWFIKSGVETAVIAGLLLLLVTVVSQVRGLYNQDLDERLDTFEIADTESEKTSESLPLSPALGPVSGAGPMYGAEGSESFTSEESEDDVASDGDSENSSVKANSSEVWRFNLRTDSPHDLRPKVVEILTQLGIPATTPGLGGIEAPGGIQFDIVIPHETVTIARTKLQALATPPKNLDETGVQVGDAFTWYKNKSKKPLPHGKSRVVIWLSLM